MKITAVSELPELVELVHDYWFDVEKIVFDRARKSVTFRVEPKRAYVEAGSSKGIAIEIRNVEDLIVADTEKVGYYDINQITFDAGKNALLLTGGIPIEIVFRVSALEIHTSATNPHTSSTSTA